MNPLYNLKNKFSVPFITLEGVDGSGKSSHLDFIANILQEYGFNVVQTREPGGTVLGEKLRVDILNTPMNVKTEVLLAFASRSEHLSQVILKSLSENKAVLCDRFTDSSYAYQGFGSGCPLDLIESLEKHIQEGFEPNLTFLFDLPVETSFQRLKHTNKILDKFETKTKDYFEKVKFGYQNQIKNNPFRFIVIDSSLSFENVQKNIDKELRNFIEKNYKKNKKLKLLNQPSLNQPSLNQPRSDSNFKP